MTARVFNYAVADPTAAKLLLQITARGEVSGDTAPKRDSAIVHTITWISWHTDIQHRWRAGTYASREINFLEVTAANMALE